jgi:hypothetical protein
LQIPGYPARTNDSTAGEFSECSSILNAHSRFLRDRHPLRTRTQPDEYSMQLLFSIQVLPAIFPDIFQSDPSCREILIRSFTHNSEFVVSPVGTHEGAIVGLSQPGLPGRGS